MNESRPHPFFWIPPALLLITAALTKAPHSLALLYELTNYGFRFSDGLNLAVSLCLPALEAFLGTALLLRRSPAAALCAFALLLLFTAGIVLALPTGYLQRCGCFGSEITDPTTAILKNAAALLLLILGFAPLKLRIGGNNAWGAFGTAAGSAWSGAYILPVYLLAGILTAREGKHQIQNYALGLLLGFALHLTGFPSLAAVAAASAVFLFQVQPAQILKIGPALIGFSLLAVSGYALLAPPEPRAQDRSLRFGEAVPNVLVNSERRGGDDRNGSLLLFLSPDCEECRDWLPTAKKLAWNTNLPPITGVIPSGILSAEEFRSRENLPFPILAVPAAEFHRAAVRPPLLVFEHSGRIAHIFPEGGIPTEDAIVEVLRHAHP
jgi:hypothetical protein